VRTNTFDKQLDGAVQRANDSVHSKIHKDGSSCFRVFYRVACEECGYPPTEARFTDWTDYSEHWERYE